MAMNTAPMIGFDEAHVAHVAADNAAKRSAFNAWLAVEWAKMMAGPNAGQAIAEGCKALCSGGAS